MAYAYLFKYIIIGDTGKRRGRGGLARPPRRRAGGAETARARLPAPISAVLASSTWWLLREEAAPSPASALGPARGLGLPLAGSAPGGLGPRTGLGARRPPPGLADRPWGTSGCVTPLAAAFEPERWGKKALSLQNLYLGSATYLQPRSSETWEVPNAIPYFYGEAKAAAVRCLHLRLQGCPFQPWLEVL